MLIRFIVSNFLSFKEETEFNMLASADQKHHKDHIYKKNSIDLLKTAALYGANGAGKSNLIKAVNQLKQIVVIGGRQVLLETRKYKLENEYQQLPSSFEIEFINNNVAYLYGLEIKNAEITEEWLYKSGVSKGSDKILFHRKTEGENTKVDFSEEYSRTEKDKFNLDFVRKNLIKKDETLLNVLAGLKEGFEEVKIGFKWLDSSLVVMFPHSKPSVFLLELFLQSQLFRNFVNSSLSSFQTGINEIKAKSFLFEDLIGNSDLEKKIRDELMSESMVLLDRNNGSEGIIALKENDKLVIKRFVGEQLNRTGENIEFFLDELSDGTNRLLDFIPALFTVLILEKTILIDEIDQSIHPVLLKELVKKFVSDEKTKGQFIFTTHEANLLDQSLFRRDEIWFVEKDHGETKLYPLSDFDIRYDLDIRKGYLNGRFGAIPFMGDLQNLNWDQYAEAE